MELRSKDLSVVIHGVQRTEREKRNHHGGAVFWFTGLPASGKSTLAMLLERRLYDHGIQVYVLDGDNVRRGLSADLGFSQVDRMENLRRVAEVAALMVDSGLVCVAAFISPLHSDRAQARRIIGKDFHEVHIKASLATCEARDPRGLYRRARAGLIDNFSGVSAPYEPPDKAELIVDTESCEIASCVDQVFKYVMSIVRTA